MNVLGTLGRGRLFPVQRYLVTQLGDQLRLTLRSPIPLSQEPRMLGMTLTALLGFLVMAGHFLWQQQKIQDLYEEKEMERAEKEAAQAEKEAAQAEKEAAQQAYAELKTALFQPAVVLCRIYSWVVPLGMTVLLGLLFTLWRQQKKIQALSKEKERERTRKEAAQAEREAAQWEKEAAQAEAKMEQSAKEKLQDELRWTNIPYLPRGERSQAYAELKTALFQPADVILDADTAHPALRVSEDQRSLQRADAWQNLPENPKGFDWAFCVLGCESFPSGRHFWEVEVGDRAQWCVGVCRETVRKKGNVKMAPKNGFWTVGLNPGNHYLALTDPQTTLTIVSPPKRVGVFLDYELGKVSFYNAINGTHLFTFPRTSFSGPLRPVFCIWTTEPTPLTICPAQN